MKLQFLKATLVSLAILVSSFANAGLIYENGLASEIGTRGGNNPFALGSFVAMDFELSDAANITGLTFNAYTTSAAIPFNLLNIKIYQNNLGAFGNELFSGGFNGITQELTGSTGSYRLTNYSVDINNWALDAGSYFIGLNAGPGTSNLHWSIVNSIAGGSYRGDAAGTPASYNSYTFEHYFKLTGGTSVDVPEPSTLAIFALGMIGLASRRFNK